MSAKSRKGLGKGLEALIPTDSVSEEPSAGIAKVPLDAIVPNPHQPRTEMREQDLEELAASIESHGVIQPLIVTQGEGQYTLVAGERRWRASRLAGLTEIPVIIKDVAPQQMLELALVENIQREDLSPLEEATAYRQLAEEFGLTHEEISQRVGKSRTAVSNTLRLLKASQPVQEALMNGDISEGHARALLALENDQAQTSALKMVLRKELNVRQTEELVRRLQNPEAVRKPPSETTPEVQAVEARFRELLGTRVSLSPGKKGGRLTIYYYSDEELEGIFERLSED